MIGARAITLILEALDDPALVAFRRTIGSELERRAKRPIEENEPRRVLEKHLLQPAEEELDVCGCEAQGMRRLRAAIVAKRSRGTPLPVDDQFVRDSHGQPVSLVERITSLLEAVDNGDVYNEVEKTFRPSLRGERHWPKAHLKTSTRNTKSYGKSGNVVNLEEGR